MALDPRTLKTSELCRLLNSTPLGAVTTERKLRLDRLTAGYRIGDGKTNDLVRYTAWLAERRHASGISGQGSGASVQGSGANPKRDPSSIRDSQAALMRTKRASERDVEIPRIQNPKRRAKAERDCFIWLSTYMSKLFNGTWTDIRKEMVQAILTAAEFGGDQAIAGPRGEGKSKIAIGVTMYCICKRLVRFVLICAATGPFAGNMLRDIKNEFERNALLAADYPEICAPIQALAGANNRASAQTVGGQRTHMEWSGNAVIFPTVAKEGLTLWPKADVNAFAPEGSRASGAIIQTKGLDAAIRGVGVGELRPELVIIDDPETPESARSFEQTRLRKGVIENDIGGLAAPGKSLARVMLTTIQNVSPCLSYTYTDPEKKPSWNGRRFKFVLKWPEREDMWEEYLQMRAEDQQKGDRFFRRAHAFYLKHRAEMDRGAVVSNPDRFDGKKIPLTVQAPGDGASLADYGRLEVSPIQSAYNLIGDRGREYFDCELQNDPPKQDGPVQSAISASRIQLRLSGYDRYIVPPDIVCLTQGMDIKKAGSHWVVRAWRADGTNFTIDYGFHESHGTTYATDQGVEIAMYNLVLERMDALRATRYSTEEGELIDVGMTLVDCRWQKSAIVRACLEIGLNIRPSMGHGKSKGCVTPNFHDIWKRTIDRKPGDGWFEQRQPDGIWLVHCDTDRWKSWEHARWMTGEGRPGAAYLYGDMTPTERKHLGQRMPMIAKYHHAYARHLTAEIEEEDPRGGRKWIEPPGRVHNHWFDASYLSDVASSMLGIKLIPAIEKKKSDPQERPTPAQYAVRR